MVAEVLREFCAISVSFHCVRHISKWGKYNNIGQCATPLYTLYLAYYIFCQVQVQCATFINIALWSPHLSINWLKYKCKYTSTVSRVPPLYTLYRVHHIYLYTQGLVRHCLRDISGLCVHQWLWWWAHFGGEPFVKQRLQARTKNHQDCKDCPSPDWSTCSAMPWLCTHYSLKQLLVTKLSNQVAIGLETTHKN